MQSQLSRRQFSSRVVLALTVVGVPFAASGCGIFSDILAWTAVAGTAIDGIVTVLGPLVSPGASAIIQAIKAFLTDLAAAVSAYENDTNPADKATLLARIRTLLTDIAANMQSFFGQITNNSPVVAIALGLAQVVLAAIEGFLGELPTTGAKTISASLSAGGKTITVTPVYYKRVGDFKKAYNAYAAANGHPEVEIK